MNTNEWETDRLILKLTNIEDLEYLAPMLLDDNVTKYLTEHVYKIPNIISSKSFLKDVLKNYFLVYTIRIKTTNEIIGQIGYCGNERNRLEIFYWIGAEYQGQGYGTESVVELSNELFKQLEFDIFSICFHEENISSQKLAQKIGSRMLEDNPTWTVIDREDRVTECEIVYIDEEYVIIKEKIKDEKIVENYNCANKQEIPIEYTQIGKKYTEKLCFLEISKNNNKN